ncbi:MAG: hypothetical protein H0U77_11430, partial [Nocardioidaceae bacterium]|nr:hypothetical protein [Nocardioidaceae bacterium]
MTDVAVSVLLATCAEVPDGDDDERLGAAAMRALGVEVGFGVWDDPSVDWSAPDLVVVRSTWDYARRHDAFLAWADSVPRLANPAEVIAWNTDKRYLADLASAGVPVVPTSWYEPGDTPPTPDGAVVVKPTISAGARDTRRHDDPGAATAHVDELLATGRSVMVQPYMAQVDALGETGIVFVAGAFSHAFRKSALLGAGTDATSALFAAEDITPQRATARQRAAAEQVLDAVGGTAARGNLLYARVDLVPGDDGTPLLLELELTEPSLFLGAEPGA